MDQPSIFDEFDRREAVSRAADGSLEGFRARYSRGELLPGESCPGCGHIFERGGHDGSRDHHLDDDPAGSICSGMALARRHLAIALSGDLQWQRLTDGDEAQRAINAGWPEATVHAWQANPRELLHELTPHHRPLRTFPGAETRTNTS